MEDTTMAKGRITKRAVDALQPGQADVFLWDDQLPGFGCRCRPSGQRYYILKYRAGGKQKWLSIARHGVLTPDQAREEAKRLLGKAALGQDPAKDRDAAKTANTMEELSQLFTDEHVRKLKYHTRDNYMRCIRLYINPAVGKLNVKTVQYNDIAAFHNGLHNKPYQANRCLAILSKMFNWAEKKGLRSDNSNPCRHVDKFKEQGRERFLSQAELGRLRQVLDKADKDHPYVVAAIWLLILTGARKNEILSLKWDYVDLDRGWLHLPDSKSGKKTIVLNQAAQDLLANLPRVEGNPYVIVGDRPGRHLIGLQRSWDRLRKEAGLGDVRVHDLRHSFASFGIAEGMSLPMIGALLGHKHVATTQRYAHLADDPIREAANRIGAAIGGVVNGGGHKKN
jgi:integrase